MMRRTLESVPTGIVAEAQWLEGLINGRAGEFESNAEGYQSDREAAKMEEIGCEIKAWQTASSKSHAVKRRVTEPLGRAAVV